MTASPKFFFPLAACFSALHYFALRSDLYWYAPWLDVLMHTWGGFLVIYGFIMLGSIGSGKFTLATWLLPLLLILIMVAWEVFEYAFGLTVMDAYYVRDTTFDIICGAAGGWLAYLLTKKRTTS